jgi:hypothetical protein
MNYRAICARRATSLILLFSALLFIATALPASAQTAKTRAQLYQNTAPYSGVIGDIIASMGSTSELNTWTGNQVYIGSIISEGPFRVTVNLPTLSTCGTNPTVTAKSSSSGGEITLGTGSPTACTLTWNTVSKYTNDSWCVFGAGSSATAAISGGWYVSAHSDAAVTLTLGTGTSGAVFEYSCFGT